MHAVGSGAGFRGAGHPETGPTGIGGRGLPGSCDGGSPPAGRRRWRLPCPPGPRRAGCWRHSGPTGGRTATSWPSTTAMRDRRAGSSSGARAGAGSARNGPRSSTGPGGPASRTRPVRWVTGSTADLVEWSYRGDGLRITRSALLLRGRRLALFSVLAEGRGTTWKADATMRLAMPPAVEAATGRAIPSPGTGRVETARRRAGPADRPAVPPLSDRARVVPGRGTRAHPAAGTHRPAVLAPPARLLGPGAAPQGPELAGADRLGTIAGRRPRPGLRRAGELGARRDLRHLPQPRPARPPRLPRLSDRRTGS